MTVKLINSYFKLIFCFMVGGFPHVYGFYECFYLSMLFHMDADIFDVNKVRNRFRRELNEIRKWHLHGSCNSWTTIWLLTALMTLLQVEVNYSVVLNLSWNSFFSQEVLYISFILFSCFFTCSHIKPLSVKIVILVYFSQRKIVKHISKI